MTMQSTMSTTSDVPNNAPAGPITHTQHTTHTTQMDKHQPHTLSSCVCQHPRHPADAAAGQGTMSSILLIAPESLGICTNPATDVNDIQDVRTVFCNSLRTDHLCRGLLTLCPPPSCASPYRAWRLVPIQPLMTTPYMGSATVVKMPAGLHLR